MEMETIIFCVGFLIGSVLTFLFSFFFVVFILYNRPKAEEWREYPIDYQWKDERPPPPPPPTRPLSKGY